MLIVGFANTLNSKHTEYVARAIKDEVAHNKWDRVDIDMCEEFGELAVIVHGHDPECMNHLVEIGLLSTFFVDAYCTEDNAERLKALYHGTKAKVEHVDDFEGQLNMRVHVENVQYSSDALKSVYYAVLGFNNN